MDGLNVGVIEIQLSDDEQDKISYSNSIGFKLLQNLFRLMRPELEVPEMLQENTFLLSQLQDSTSDADQALQTELLKMPILRLHRAK